MVLESGNSERGWAGGRVNCKGGEGGGRIWQEDCSKCCNSSFKWSEWRITAKETSENHDSEALRQAAGSSRSTPEGGKLSAEMGTSHGSMKKAAQGHVFVKKMAKRGHGRETQHKVAFSSSRPMFFVISCPTYSNVKFDVVTDICRSFSINQEKKILEESQGFPVLLCSLQWDCFISLLSYSFQI